LDHIDELAIPLQARLLRALERREIRRVGGIQNVTLDVRVIAACTRALGREVRLGAFKPELYVQVGSERARIPALRQRLEDLTLLAEEILSQFQPPRTLPDIPEHVWAAFRAYHWPGNVRELRNALQRTVVMPDRALRFIRGQ
jgi:transcriptional regulator with PAS, ATPase and Fis domain